MRMPYLSQGALMVFIILLAACPARAQHHAAAGHAQGANVQAAHHGNPTAIHQMTPQLQKQMEQQYQQAIIQEQAQMAAMVKQAQHAHQQRLQSFNEWVKNDSASSGQSQSSSLSHLPQSPGAFAAWYKTQKHNKAVNKSYDPAYDQYRGYEKSQQASRLHRNHSNTTATAHQTQNPQPSTTGECPARAGRSIVPGPVVYAAIEFAELAATDSSSDVRGSVDQFAANADGPGIPDSVNDAAIECP